MIFEPHELSEIYKERGRMAAFARDAGMDYSHVASIMRGKYKNPRADTLKKLTDYAVENNYCRLRISYEFL